MGPTTNATALHRGDRAASPLTGPPPGWWSYRSGVERAAIKCAVITTELTILWLQVHGHNSAVRQGTTYVASAALAVAGWRIVGALIAWNHRREVVRPLARGLARYVGRHEGERPTWLDVPRDWHEGDTRPVVVRLPHHVVGGELLAGRPVGEWAAIESIMAAKLGRELSFTWNTSGRRPQLLARPKHFPPEVVRWSDPAVRELVTAADSHAPVLGLAARDRPVAVDLQAVSAHVLIAAATGGGKSTMVKALAAQMIARGASCTILDHKRISAPWARGLPGVEIVRDIGDIHAALVALGAECDRRIHLADAHEDDPDFNLPRHLIVVEESNATVSRVRRWYDQTKQPGMPRRAPGIDALADILFMSRQVNMTVIMVAQSGTVASLGGDPAVREQFAARCLARYSQNAARMLVPEVSPLPKSSRHLGRATVVTGGEPHATQVIWMDDDEAHEYAASGATDTTAPTLTPAREIPTDSQTAIATPLRVVPEPEVPRYTLGEAAAAEVVPLGYEALRKARQRDASFPAGLGAPERYTADELQRWHRNRLRPRGQTREG